MDVLIKLCWHYSHLVMLQMNLRNYPEIEMEFDADIAGVAAEIIEKAGGRHNSLSCCLIRHLGCMYLSSAMTCMHVC